jgi:hypothetical protein
MVSLVNMPVFAGNLYSNFMISQVKIDRKGAEVKPMTGSLKIGYQFAKSFALEGYYGTGISDDSVNGTTVEVDKETAVFLRIGGNSSYNGVRLYLLAGQTKTELKTDPANSGDTEFKGGAWGIGAEEFSRKIKNMAYVFEYIRYYSGSDADITGISLGLRYNF